MRDFINARINKDNFWNLIFATLLFVGMSLGFIIKQPFGWIICFIMTTAAIALVKYNCHLTFDKEKIEFTTSQGLKIQKAGVLFIWLFIISFFLAGGVVNLISEATNIEEAYLITTLFSFFFSLFPSLYCILRNFPISVYFKKEAWIGNGQGSYGSVGSDGISSNNLFNDSTRTSISYDYLPNNVWHSSYLNRRR